MPIFSLVSSDFFVFFIIIGGDLKWMENSYTEIDPCLFDLYLFRVCGVIFCFKSFVQLKRQHTIYQIDAQSEYIYIYNIPNKITNQTLN